MENNHDAPLDVTDGIVEYLKGELKTIQAKCDRYEAALKGIINTNYDNHEKVILKVKSIANEAISAGEGELCEKCGRTVKEGWACEQCSTKV